MELKDEIETSVTEDDFSMGEYGVYSSECIDKDDKTYITISLDISDVDEPSDKDWEDNCDYGAGEAWGFSYNDCDTTCNYFATDVDLSDSEVKFSICTKEQEYNEEFEIEDETKENVLKKFREVGLDDNDIEKLSVAIDEMVKNAIEAAQETWLEEWNEDEDNLCDRCDNCDCDCDCDYCDRCDRY